MFSSAQSLSHRPARPFCIFLASILGATNINATAQSPAFVASGGIRSDGPTEDRAPEQGRPAKPALNGYAEQLVPRTKRSSTARMTPYQPISKPQDQAQVVEIEMFVGESRVFPTPGVSRIAVGNGQIMTAAALDGKEVILFANGVGTSSLFVWNDDGRYQRIKINIVPGDTSRVAREIAAFLSTIPNSKASVIGDKVIVEGDDLTDRDIAKIVALNDRYPQIVNFTNRLGWEQMVFMDVKVVEFPTSELRDLGLKWGATGGAAVGALWSPLRRGNGGNYQINLQSDNAPIVGQGGGAVVLPSGLNVLSMINLGLNAQLNLLVQNGKASILAEPQLSARNGAKASFLAGGEFPYTVTTIAGPTTMFKPYGIKLDIAPRVDRNGVVRATIDSEVSAIDTSISTTSGPALSTRRTNTEFNVRSGETLVLSGLLSRKTSTGIDKVPLLGDIPVLGALFRSKRFENNETELVVFVTPTVVDSRTPGQVETVQRVTERLQQDFGKPLSTLGIGHEQRAIASSEAAPPNLASSDVQVSSAAVPRTANASSEMPSSLPSPVPTAAAAPNRLHPQGLGGSSLQVAKEGLIVYAEPRLQSAALMRLGVGALVQLTDVEPQPTGVGVWRQVVIGKVVGWVEAQWVTPAKLEPLLPANSSGEIARIDKDGSMLELGRSGYGTDRTDARSVTANSAGDSSRSGAATKRYQVLLDGLAMRVAADINAAVLLQLPAGSVVEALPQVASDQWTPVQAQGKRGWVAAQWLRPLN